MVTLRQGVREGPEKKREVENEFQLLSSWGGSGNEET
jgi:hypothetical protein